MIDVYAEQRRNAEKRKSRETEQRAAETCLFAASEATWVAMLAQHEARRMWEPTARAFALSHASGLATRAAAEHAAASRGWSRFVTWCRSETTTDRGGSTDA